MAASTVNSGVDKNIARLAEEADIVRYSFSDQELKVAQDALSFRRAALSAEEVALFTYLSALLCRVRHERTRRYLKRTQHRIGCLRRGMERNHSHLAVFWQRTGSSPSLQPSFGKMLDAPPKRAPLAHRQNAPTIPKAWETTEVKKDSSYDAPLCGVSDLSDGEIQLVHAAVSSWWNKRRADTTPDCSVGDLLCLGGLYHKLDAEATRRDLQTSVVEPIRTQPHAKRNHHAKSGSAPANRQ